MSIGEQTSTPEVLFKLRDVALPISDSEAVAHVFAPVPPEELVEDPAHYAWFRLPRFLHERETTFDETKSPAISLDLCSAVPLYAELVSSLNYRLCELAAKDTLQSVRAVLSKEPGNIPVKDQYEVSHSDLWQRLFKNETIGALLGSIIAETHYRLPLNFDGAKHQADVASWFEEEATNRVSSNKRWSLDNGTIEGRWKIDYQAVGHEATILEEVAKLPVPSLNAFAARRELERRSLLKSGQTVIDHTLQLAFELGDSYTTPEEQLYREAAETTALGEYIEPFILVQRLCALTADLAVSHRWWRPLAVYSVDAAEPAELVQSAQVSFDSETKRLTMFGRAIDRIQSETHSTADVLHDDLGFPEESVCLITCFEGLPFHERIPDRETDEYAVLVDSYKRFLARTYTILKPGGRIVIFPWSIQEDSIESIPFLRKLYEHTANQNPSPHLSQNGYTVEQLKDWMRGIDTSGMLWSPLFKDTDGCPLDDDRVLDSLVIVKPREGRFPHGDRGR